MKRFVEMRRILLLACTIILFLTASCADEPAAPAATETPTASVAAPTQPSPTSTQTAQPTATSAPTETPLSTPTPTPSPILPSVTPSATPFGVNVDGLIVWDSHYRIIKQHEPQPLAYADLRQLDAKAAQVGLAVSADGRVFGISEEGLERNGRIYIQTADGKELFFDDDTFEVKRIHGIVGEWLLASAVDRADPPSQALGDLMGIALDGSSVQHIASNTEFSPAVAPDQSHVIYVEADVVKLWTGDGDSQTLPLPPYWFGRFSPNGRYLTLGMAGELLTIYDATTYQPIVSDQTGYFGMGSFSWVSWSPTSEQVAFFDQVLREETAVWNLRLLSIDGQAVDFEGFYEPAFSPDGQKLAAVRVAQPAAELVVINLATGEYSPAALSEPVGSPALWLERE